MLTCTDDIASAGDKTFARSKCQAWRSRLHKDQPLELQAALMLMNEPP